MHPLPDLLLVASPPFGPALWDQAAARLTSGGLHAHTHDLLAPDEGGAASVRRAADALAERLRRLGQDGPVVLVAHGSAVPVALLAAARTPPAGLVLSNGPLDRPPRLLRAFARLPSALLAHGLLRPQVWLPLLASSAGLRRAVVNPYVMDRDMVVAVCASPVQTSTQRASLASFWRDLAAPRPAPPAFPGPTLLAWGDADPLYPPSEIDRFRQHFPNVQHVNIPGGHHLHPIERPWALADATLAWIRQGMTAT